MLADTRSQRLVVGAHRAVQAAEDAVVAFVRRERAGLAAELTVRAEAAQAAQQAALPALAAAVAEDGAVRAAWREWQQANGMVDTLGVSPLRGFGDSSRCMAAGFLSRSRPRSPTGRRMSQSLDGAGASPGGRDGHPLPGGAPRPCVVCGEPLAGRRAHARFCSGACRAEASRVRRILAGQEADGYRTLAQRHGEPRNRTDAAGGG